MTQPHERRKTAKSKDAAKGTEKPKRRMYYEAAAQRGVIAWARKHTADHPALGWLHSIPNGGRRSPHEAAMERDLGLVRGIPDLFLPWGTENWNGLYIEMKAYNPQTKHRGRLSEEQKDFFEYCGGAGYKTAVCYSSDEAVDVLCDYLGIRRTANEARENGGAA